METQIWQFLISIDNYIDINFATKVRQVDDILYINSTVKTFCLLEKKLMPIHQSLDLELEIGI